MTNTVHLEGLSQQQLIELFFDWFDAAYSEISPLKGDKQSIENVMEIRSRIDITSSSGFEANKGDGQ